MKTEPTALAAGLGVAIVMEQGPRLAPTAHSGTAFSSGHPDPLPTEYCGEREKKS